MAETPLVLVVDDNEMNRDMLARRLQRQSCEVIMAEDGAAALEAVTKHAFDLILLDIMMPNVSGYEVLEKLKADASTRHIPVIMISAVDDLDSVVRCIEMGAEDYLFKPFNPVLLKARVTASLGRRQAGEAGLASHINGLRDALSVWEQEASTEASRAALAKARTHLEALARLAQ
jgi:DNA-binding response OmpR family regulator